MLQATKNIHASSSRSLFCFEPNPTARLRLFCFPYAGGNATIFRHWAGRLPSTVELWASQPRGRGNRIKGALLTSISQVVDDLAPGFDDLVDKPFVFFGHSLGAVVAFELAQRLVQERQLEPAHLIVSGHRAPQIPRTDPPIYDLPDGPFIEELRRLKGTAREILEHAELMQLIIPVLRADFEICDTYVYSPRPALSCAVTALGGLQDTEVPPESIRQWEELTTGRFLMRMLRGDHFFLHSAETTVLRIVTDVLQDFVETLPSS